MQFWEEYKKLISGCVIALMALGIVHIAFFRPVRNRVYALADENATQTKALASYYPETGMLVEELKTAFERSNRDLEEEYEMLRARMVQKLEPPFIVPANEAQKGFYFRRLLTTKRQEVGFYVSRKGMDSIDESLGFGESVPPEAAVDEMLIQLASACEITMAAADAGVRSVSSLSHGGCANRGVAGYAPFMEERSIHLSIQCDLDSLTRFIHGLDKRKYPFGLKSLSFQTGYGAEDTILSVRLECVTFAFMDPEEAILKEKEPRTGRPGRIKAPTYGM